MARAIELAQHSRYISKPNPRVGCVIVRDDSIIAEGWTQRAGGNHAEIEALEQLGHDATGATLYVTLEPCCHTGRTGPCTDALIKSGVSHVVAAMSDPNQKVAGKGFHKLEEAGIAVTHGMLESEAVGLNPGFIQRMRTGKPRVVVKVGATMDGSIADYAGTSQWITGHRGPPTGASAAR